MSLPQWSGIRQYQIAFDLSGNTTIRINPKAIDIEAPITAPSGKEITICAFYFLGYPRAELMSGAKRA